MNYRGHETSDCEILEDYRKLLLPHLLFQHKGPGGKIVVNLFSSIEFIVQAGPECQNRLFYFISLHDNNKNE